MTFSDWRARVEPTAWVIALLSLSAARREWRRDAGVVLAVGRCDGLDVVS